MHLQRIPDPAARPEAVNLIKGLRSKVVHPGQNALTPLLHHTIPGDRLHQEAPRQVDAHLEVAVPQAEVVHLPAGRQEVVDN